MPRPPRQLGFTLFEALVAVAVLGILLTIAVPSFLDTIHRKRVSGIADELASDLTHAKNLSGDKQVSFSWKPVPVVQFGPNARGPWTCYGIYWSTIDETLLMPLVAPPCSCDRTPGQACTFGSAPNPEVKTISFASNPGINISSNRNQQREYFNNFKYTSGFGVVFEISGSRPGKLQVQVNPAGRVLVCSPDGLIGGYARC